jgi:monoterpene epsilon-lactone hydrolase
VSTILVPARHIPVPTSISPEAQAVLSMGILSAETAYPAVGDVEGWRALVAAQDEVVTQMLGEQVRAIAAERERREVDGAGVYVVTPESIGDDDRVVFDIHGGGFILQGGEACAAMTVIAAARLGLRTWGVDYRMPPDHPYPAPLDDCVRAYRALLDEVSADRIVVAGGSAGGNLAAALVVRARDEGLPLPAAAVLATPEVDLTESGDSFQTNLGVDPILGRLMPVNELYAAGHDLRGFVPLATVRRPVGRCRHTESRPRPRGTHSLSLRTSVVPGRSSSRLERQSRSSEPRSRIAAHDLVAIAMNMASERSVATAVAYVQPSTVIIGPCRCPSR